MASRSRITLADLRRAHRTPYHIRLKVGKLGDFVDERIESIFFRQVPNRNGYGMYDAISGIGVLLDSAGGTTYKVFEPSEWAEYVDAYWA